MTYETKMLLRLAAPAVVVLGVGLALATMASTLSDLLKAMGGAPLFDGIGDVIALATAILAGGVYFGQMLRYWRWTEGGGDLCFVCTCLLGRERDGRFGPYRKCLGCGKNHALGRI
jgi:hypothetical protein